MDAASKQKRFSLDTSIEDVGSLSSRGAAAMHGTTWRKVREAVTLYERAIQLQPQRSFLWLRKGSVHLKLDEIDEAINCLKQAELLHARLNDLSRSDVELLRHKMALARLTEREYARDVWHAVRDKFQSSSSSSSSSGSGSPSKRTTAVMPATASKAMAAAAPEQIEPEVVITPLPTASRKSVEHEPSLAPSLPPNITIRRSGRRSVHSSNHPNTTVANVAATATAAAASSSAVEDTLPNLRGLWK